VAQFILIAVVAFLLSNWSYKWLEDVPVLKQCMEDGGTVTCYGALAVYRVTFGLTVYHAILALFLIGVKNSTDWRASIQDGWFPVKFIALVGLVVLSFLIPNSFFRVYGWIMVVGAAFFILIQLVLLVEFAYSWAESWLLKMEDEELETGGDSKKWYILLLTATFALLAAGIALTGAMYKLFCPSDCGVNIFFVTFNLIAGLAYCALAVHPKVREGRPSSGMLQAAVVFVYSTYLVWSALMSEPSDDGCNPFSTFSHGSQAVSLTIGAAFTILSVVYSTIRAGTASNELLGSSDNQKPLLSTDEEDGEGPAQAPDDETEETTYNYSFFHLSFALGGMYVCMLLTNWMTITGVDAEGVAVDTGYVSVWVKMVSSWLTVLMYVWSLIAPIVLPDREWN